MLVAVLSVKGSPGVTTFSVALAARWPHPARVLLVEADTSGGDVATRFALASTPGLLSLAAAARRSEDPALAWQHTQALPGGLPVVTAPPDADRARAALSALVPDHVTRAGVVRSAAEGPDTVVIADCGRVDAGSAAMSIVGAADVMLLLSRAHADDLAHLATRVNTVGGWSTRPALLLVGEGYSTAEVARELGVAVLGRIPEDPYGAAVLCGRPNRLRWTRGGPARSALGQVAGKVARTLVSQHRAPVGSPALVGPNSHPVLGLRAVPGVPGTPVSAGGLRLAPTPRPAQPGVDEDTSRGGAAS